MQSKKITVGIEEVLIENALKETGIITNFQKL